MNQRGFADSILFNYKISRGIQPSSSPSRLRFHLVSALFFFFPASLFRSRNFAAFRTLVSDKYAKRGKRAKINVSQFARFALVPLISTLDANATSLRHRDDYDCYLLDREKIILHKMHASAEIGNADEGEV